jgi:hypothetical protein
VAKLITVSGIVTDSSSKKLSTIYVALRSGTSTLLRDTTEFRNGILALNNISEPVSERVFTLMGQQIMQKEFPVYSTGNIDLRNNLAQGSYLIKIVRQGNTSVSNFFVK